MRVYADALTGGVTDQPLAPYLRWWIEHEAPKGKPGRAPLAESTVRGYRSNIEIHIIPDRARLRLSVVWQLDKWGGLVRPTSPSARRTLPLRPEVVEVLEGWHARQDVWADRLGEAGVHPRKAQAFLGHAEMTTTMRYYTASGNLDDLASLLPNFDV